jgi:hypothetical protein
MQLNMQARFVVMRLESILERRLVQIGPVSCAGADFLVTQSDFRNASGVYLISDGWFIRYIGSSEDSLGHRTFQRLKAIRAGQYEDVDVSTVLGLQTLPHFAATQLEWLAALIYRLLFSRLPMMNRKMPPRPADWRDWLPKLRRPN